MVVSVIEKLDGLSWKRNLTSPCWRSLVQMPDDDGMNKPSVPHVPPCRTHSRDESHQGYTIAEVLSCGKEFAAVTAGETYVTEGKGSSYTVGSERRGSSDEAGDPNHRPAECRSCHDRVKFCHD